MRGYGYSWCYDYAQCETQQSALQAAVDFSAEESSAESPGVAGVVDEVPYDTTFVEPAAEGFGAVHVDAQVGLGAAADQIATAIKNAEDAANQTVPAFGTAVGYCSAATGAARIAEQSLQSKPSMSIIGAADAVTQQLVSNGFNTVLDYNKALAAAKAAQLAFLTDSANQPPPPPPPPPKCPAGQVLVNGQCVPQQGPPPPPPPPPPPTQAASTDSGTVLLVAGVAAASIVSYALYKRYYAKPPSFSRAKTRVPSGRGLYSAVRA